MIRTDTLAPTLLGDQPGMVIGGDWISDKIGPADVQGFHHGLKQSGLGGEDGEHGYQRCVQHKTVYLGYGTGS
jgi:lactaldehyde dehydrogenase / glycolaldehyde dehydrogenase